MIRSVAKYLALMVTFIGIPWAVFEWQDTSQTSKDHITCLAAFLPSEQRDEFKGTIDHHINLAIKLAQDDGKRMSRSDVRTRAMQINKGWVKSAKSEEDFLEKITATRRRCAGI